MAIPLAFTTCNAAQDAKAAFEGEDAVIVRAADGIWGADFVRVEGLSALLVELARIDDVFILNRGASHVRPERGDHVSWGTQTLDVRVWLGRHLKKRGDLDLRLERGRESLKECIVATQSINSVRYVPTMCPRQPMRISPQSSARHTWEQGACWKLSVALG